MWKNDLQERIMVSDGGMATELERNGFSLLHNPLWSASLLQKNPAAIINVHKSFLEHGAEILTTSSYQASIPGFQKHLGLTENESKNLLKLSVELAEEARKQFLTQTKSNKNIIIAGSIGPYGASLADGSEYSGNYCDTMTHEELITWHRPRIQCLLEAGVDLLAFETIPAQKEGEALMKLLADIPNIPAWLSFSSQTMHQTSHGEDMGGAALNCLKRAPASRLVAVGVNCCPPQYVDCLLKDIADVSCKHPLIAYPNSGEVWDTHSGWSGSKAEPNYSYLESWMKSGAKIIGGCCRTTPDDIAGIAKFVQENVSS